MGTRTGARRVAGGTNVTVFKRGGVRVEAGHRLFLINGDIEAGALISRDITAEFFFFKQMGCEC